ncbi:Uncharacterised protein [Serratia quinivorans]|uniref:hypothetical protein n=1 Tax=Serratia quinivorans TaxID=137545 RepID=UPI002179057C|nr:hypothetical protein [Serratia quinivorans]CAI2058498.1 Uncharacterised protein [Serratia quinivorans]
MPLFTCGFPPKKSAAANGTIALAIAVEAKNAKLAEMKATMLLEESFPDSTNNFFKPKICADREGLPRPPIDTFDADWMTFNQWNEETKEFEPIVLPDDEEEEETFTTSKTIFELPVDVRVAYILMYGAEPETVDQEHLSNAYDLINDDEAEPRLRAIVDALPRVPQVKSMLVTSVEKLIEAIQAKSPAMTSWPEVKKFADSWVHTANSDRPQSTESNITRTYSMLDNEVALAIIGVNPINAKAADVKSAKELIEQRNPIWRAWSMSLRIIVGILDVDREIIYELLSAGLAHPDFATRNGLRTAFIQGCLSESCGMVFDNVVQPAAAKENIPAETAQPTASNDGEKTEVHNLGGGKFSIDGLVGAAQEPKAATKTLGSVTKPPIAATEPPKSEPKPADPLPVETDTVPADDFETRATIMERELAAKEGDAAKNLDIWKRVQRTDPARTKKKETKDNTGKVIRTVTSIRPTYQYMRATEIFGPFGIGWGVDVLDERFDPGIPLMEAVVDSAGRETGKRVMRDGDGTILTSLNHTMKIMLWYIHGGVRGEIIAYGHTKYRYASKFGLSVDDEPSKKSLTDATTKALSSLGFSADVYLGMFDDTEYSQENAYEHSIKNASDKAEDSVRLRKELDERFKANTETMRSAVTRNEVIKISSSLTRVIGSHIKSAKAVSDTGHVKYLESRLTRLEEIKVQCLAKFEEEKEA